MAVFIIRRGTAKDGKPRYHVRYQASKFARPVHLGAFRTQSEARMRKEWALAEVAAGRVPDRASITAVRVGGATLREAAEAWVPTRVDVEEGTRMAIASNLAHALAVFGEREPAEITTRDVQAWVLRLELAPSTMRHVVGALRQLLDFVGVEPNPVASKHLRLPKMHREPLNLPSRAELDRILRFIPPAHVALLRLLEHTGLRVGSAVNLRAGDYDEARNRVWVQDKTAAGRRWVQLGAVPDYLPVKHHYVTTLGELPPVPEDEHRRIFSGTRSSVCRAMVTACERAGTRRFTPHDLRHLHATRLLADGWNPGDVAARLGHSSPVITLSTYAHAVPPD